MPVNPQPAASIPLPGVQSGPPEIPKADSTADEESLKRELARLTPANEKLLALAEKSAPPPEWLDEEEELPF